MSGNILQSLESEIKALKSENMRLRLEREEFKTIFMISKNGIAILDLKSNFLSVNPAYLELSGLTEEELLETSCIALSIEEDIPRSKAVIKKVIEVGYVQNYEKTCILKDGKHVVVNMSLALLPDKKTILINTLDVTEKRALQIEIHKQKEKFKKQAHFDEVTNLPNRISFNYHLKKAINNAYSMKKQFALMYLDLNKFKNINDTYGHSVGDEALKIIATNINNIVRSNDFFARIGGDEFAIILYNTINADRLSKDIIGILKEITEVNKYHVDLSVSIGITVYPENATSFKDLLISADMAMYEAKYSKDRNIVFSRDTIKSEV